MHKLSDRQIQMIVDTLEEVITTTAAARCMDNEEDRQALLDEFFEKLEDEF